MPLPQRLLIFGDSVAEAAFKPRGFGHLINEKLNGTTDVIVRSFPGYSTSWVKLTVSCCARNLVLNPTYIVFILGNDDCFSSSSNSTSPPTPTEFKKLLNSVVNKMTNEVDVKFESLIFMTPLPSDELKFDSYDANRLSGVTHDRELVSKYTKMYREVAERQGGKLINSSEILDRNFDNNFKRDGFRLSEEGHEAIAEAILGCMTVNKPVFPPRSEIKDEKELTRIIENNWVIPPDNIQAHTYVGTVDEYSAFFQKTYKGAV